MFRVCARRSSTYAQVYRSSIDHPEQFWSEQAQKIFWFKRWHKVYDENNLIRPHWFQEGHLNMTYNCLDRHIPKHGHQTAIIHDSAMTGKVAHVTYKELLKEVKTLANVLSKKYNVKKGDVVLIYMPMIPEAIVAMLACARIGAIHNLVFGGFSANELAVRIKHSEPKLLISANVGFEPQRTINYKTIVDEAIKKSGITDDTLKCIIFNRSEEKPADLTSGRDRDWKDVMDSARDYSDCEPVESNHPLYLLYTSGTTGTPKAIVRPTGGYAVALQWTMKHLYNVHPGEVWWSAADLGWVVGHSYGCYGPLLNGSTTIIYEGKPIGTPDASAFFRILHDHKAVSTFWSPTALRIIRQNDPDNKHATKYRLKHFRALFLAGEHCDRDTLLWAREIFAEKPVIDHYWQTETGTPITAVCLGLERHPNLGPPGCAGRPCPGYNLHLFSSDPKSVEEEESTHDELGRIVVRLPLPPGNFSTLWKNDELFHELYFTRYPGYYDTMDVGIRTEDGFIETSSRADDVLNVAGHRLSSGHIEQAIIESGKVSECAVIGLKDDIKGQQPFAFVVLNKNDEKADPTEIENAIITTVRQEIGPVAAFKKFICVKRLPKTRSGKIARNTLTALLNGKAFRIPSTIEDATVYDDLRKELTQLGYKNLGESSQM
ncbi:unnamed protein product [Rotaria sp. Silwood2]|nr:unnamed protein product [Rotaria sp. Silwood2]CAF3139234.1 unnamed protein product [Rotaria sp. Silwood2]CAF3382477.1 unnamed protein product [Rotaria sp. Silwood2]CAF3945280.1 unnamed protein product [Rotaria sp. Silwood2]CAF4388561.1 unnamed protein product [Rotaria sp. Silwood2]